MKIKVCEELDEFTEDNDFAYKDGKIYPIFRSKKTYHAGSCLGQMRVIMENGEILQWIYPMMGAGDYSILNNEMIQKYNQILKAYDKYVFTNPNI